MFSSLFKNKATSSIRFVIGLNQVDKISPNGWDNRLNMPTEKGEEDIQKRSEDIINKLIKLTKISENNIEYYSALKRYRLYQLLVKIISNAYAGFKLDNINPADPFDLADPEVKKFVEEERKKRENKNDKINATKETLINGIKKFLSDEEINLFLDTFDKEKKLPPKIAILGKSGVGKTTTINSLFNAQFKTSHTIVGTTSAQMKEFTLSSGGVITIVDLPGYGRSIEEDKEYDKIYKEIIPKCDLIFMVLQADTRDIADDQEMIEKIIEWLKLSPVPER
ncbi:MAG TPA: 50S ribosome-binding GTPase [Spirochaetota bacterium]|nr:50S ribosome-binding GTPase [Spirochaetota bacterium]